MSGIGRRDGFVAGDWSLLFYGTVMSNMFVFGNISKMKIMIILRLTTLKCIEVQHMSSTTTLQQICPVVVDSNLGVALIELNKRVASGKATFNTVLLDAVDSAFSTVSDLNSEALYAHLKQRFGLSRRAIPYDIEGFTAALEEAFGEGALLIEIQIMKALHNKCPHVEFAPKQAQLSFPKYLEHFRSQIKNM